MTANRKTFPDMDLSRSLKALQDGDEFALYAGLALLSLFVVVVLARDNGTKLPQLNPRGALEFTDIARTRKFMQNSLETLTKGRALHGSRPYRLFSDWGQLTMLPPEAIDDIRSDRRFDFAESASDDSHGYVPGFDGLKHDPAMPKIVTRHLTKALTKVTGPLSEEAALVIQKVITDDTDWHTIDVQKDTMSIVSRMSSRVFMGDVLCRDDEWNAAAADYAFKVFAATDELRAYPRWARPYVHWFLPGCASVRAALARARACLAPHVARREEIKRAALARGEEKSPFDDSIEWFVQEGSDRPPADCQISLSLVAIHTTTDLLSSTLVSIARHPELFAPLRDEVVRVLGSQGLRKTAFYELKLMDSVFKETQRLKPILLGWKRRALEDVTLPSSGLSVRAGDKVAVDMTHMWSSASYPDRPLEFDGYRFLRMRETPGQDHMAHLVSTSADHLGFGHGVHACPGRFFASNEVKVALCHLLLKYDWKLPGGGGDGEGEATPPPPPPPIAYGMGYGFNPSSKLMFRRRKEELDLSALAC